jgi:hypothetical protein
MKTRFMIRMPYLSKLCFLHKIGNYYAFYKMQISFALISMLSISELSFLIYNYVNDYVL